MRIRKRSIYLVIEAVVLLLIVGAGYYGWRTINTQWEDRNTWTTESRVILPSTADNLAVEMKGDQYNGEFSFSAKYCLLYEISSDGQKATLRCSLLPYYYTQRATAVAKDWQDKSDILLVVQKSDIEPVEFLGRQDLSFESVSTLGSEKIPVSIKIEGRAQAKDKNLYNMLQHASVVASGKRESIPVSLTKWEVTPLSKISDADKKTYVESQVAAIKAMLDKDIESPVKDISNSTRRVNTLRDYFSFDSIHCKNLADCQYEYDKNPAENYAYYLYGVYRYDKPQFTTIKKDVEQQVYPFNPIRKSPQIVGEEVQGESDWIVFVSYNFPVCPIAEVMNNESNEVTAVFHQYAKGVGDYLEGTYDIPTTEAGHLNWLMRYNKNLFVPNEVSWETDFIHQFTSSCDFLLKNGPEKYPQLRARVIDIYRDMLSTNLGVDVKLTKESISDIIYSQTAFSPYSSPAVLNSVIMKSRENFLEPTKDAGNAYAEWKSLVNTLILLYLYEAL